MKLKFETGIDHDPTPMMGSLQGALYDKRHENIDVDFFRDRCEPAGEGESPLKFLLKSVDRRLEEHNAKLDKLRIEQAQIIATIGSEFTDSVSRSIREEEDKINELNLIRARSEDVKRMIDDIVRMLRLTPKFHYKTKSDYDYFETMYSIGGIASDAAVTMSLKMACDHDKSNSPENVNTRLIIGIICANQCREGDVICKPLVEFSRGWSREPGPSKIDWLGSYSENTTSQYDWAIMKWIVKTLVDFSDYPDLGFLKDEEVDSNGHET